MKKSWLTTAAGILGLFSGLPSVWGAAVEGGHMHTPMPGWLYLTCTFSLYLSIGLVGLVAKDFNVHSTEPQVENATQEKK